MVVYSVLKKQKSQEHYRLVAFTFRIIYQHFSRTERKARKNNSIRLEGSNMSNAINQNGTGLEQQVSNNIFIHSFIILSIRSI